MGLHCFLYPCFHGPVNRRGQRGGLIAMGDDLKSMIGVFQRDTNVIDPDGTLKESGSVVGGESDEAVFKPQSADESGE